MDRKEPNEQVVYSMLTRVFDPQSILADMAERIDERTKPATRAQVAAFYRSPLGRRVVAAELMAVSAANDAAFGKAFAAQAYGPLQALKADPARARALDELISRFSHFENAVFEGVIRALFQGAAVMSGGQAVPKSVIEPAIAAMRQKLASTAAARYALAYKDLSTADLIDYNGFVASASGRAFHEALSEAVTATLSVRMEAFIEALKAEIDKKAH